MFDRFSEAARRTIFFARYEAGRLGFDEIDTPHLLLGFIYVDTGMEDAIARQLFISDTPIESTAIWKSQLPPHNPFLNADTANTLRTMFSHSGPRSEPLPTNADMQLTTRAQQVFASASEHADGGPVTPLHLLWAMLGDEQEEVASAINELGVTREQIDNEIRRDRT